MKLHINYKNGKWLVNDKELAEMNKGERLFMNSFFKEVKINSMSLEKYILHNGNERV